MGSYASLAVRDSQGNIIGYQSTSTGQIVEGVAAPSPAYQALQDQYAASRNRVVGSQGVMYQGGVTPQNPYPEDTAAGIAWRVARTGGASDIKLNAIAEQQVLRAGGSPSFIRYATDIYVERPRYETEILTAKTGQRIVNQAWEGVPIRLNLTRAEMAAGGGITEQNAGKYRKYNPETYMLDRISPENTTIGVDPGVHTRFGDFGGPILQNDGSYGGWVPGGRLRGGKTVASTMLGVEASGTDLLVPYGRNAKTRIENARMAIDPNTGELAIYQKGKSGSWGLIGGGGRNALQSGEFVAERGSISKNLSDFARPISLGKTEAPGADIPWKINQESSTIQLMGKGGVSGIPVGEDIFGGGRLVGGKTVATSLNIESTDTTNYDDVGWQIIPRDKRIYLEPPAQVDVSKDPLGFIASQVYSIPYGLVKGAETVRRQEAYDKQSVGLYSEYEIAQADYAKQVAEFEDIAKSNPSHISKDESGKFVISESAPKSISKSFFKEYSDIETSYSKMDALGIKVAERESGSPIEQLKRETSGALSQQKPLEVFGIQPTVAWKRGVEAVTFPFIGQAGVLTSFTSRTATSPIESVAYGVMDVPVMGMQMVADAPLGVEMFARDVAARGTLGISTVGGYGASTFGKYIVDDPIRATTMLVTGMAVSKGTSIAKTRAMESSGLTRMSTYEVRGEEVVANAPATRTISDVLTGKDFLDVTHTSPTPIVRGFRLASREVIGDVGLGEEKPGMFGAPIVKGKGGKTYLEPTSEYFLNKPLLVPALKSTARMIVETGKAAATTRDFTLAKQAASSASRQFMAFGKKNVPILGGPRTYIIRNIETMAPEMRTTYKQMSLDIETQLKTTGRIEPALYDEYVKLAYEKSAAGGGKPIAVIAPKKAAGYHLGDKGAMGAPFESEVYIVAAEKTTTGAIVPLKTIGFTGKSFAGYAKGPTGARVVEVGLKGQTTGFKSKSLTTILKENRKYNKDKFVSDFKPTPGLLKFGVGGYTIQKGWYDAMALDASLKAKEMFGGSTEWAPEGYYGKHGYEHSLQVAQNINTILASSPRTIEGIGGTGTNALQRAQAVGRAMGLGHDIAKIGEAETQPYTHAFITAEALKSGQLKKMMSVQTYENVFGQLSDVETSAVAKGISEHTAIQPIRAPTLAEVINWKTQPAGTGPLTSTIRHLGDFKSGVKSLADPFKGVVSKAMWRHGIEGRTLATADRMDLGRVGARIQSSKLFRTPEEQTEVNVQNAALGLTFTASALMIKSGLPPVAAGFVFTKDFMNPGKRQVSSRGAYESRSRYSGRSYGYGYQPYSAPAYLAYSEKYEKPYANLYDKPYQIPYATDYNNYVKPYNSKYSQYEKPYQKPYLGYQKPYEKSYGKPYESSYSKPRIPTPYKYQKPYTKPYETPYEKPYEKPYQKPYEKPYEYVKPPEEIEYPLPIGGGLAGGGTDGRTFAPRNLERWQRVNPVADIPYLSKGLGGPAFGTAKRTTRKKSKKR